MNQDEYRAALQQLVGPAMEVLRQFVTDPSTPPHVRLQATRYVLHLAGATQAIPKPSEAAQDRERKRMTWKLRDKIKERDEHCCQMCGSTELLVVDHIVPISRGGTSDENNLQTLCRGCNHSKGTELPEEWLFGKTLQ